MTFTSSSIIDEEVKTLPLFLSVLWGLDGLASPPPPPTKPEYVGVNMSYTPPLASFNDSPPHPEVTEGLLKDLVEALFVELKYKPVLLVLPRSRIGPSLTTGHVSLVCHLHESWQPQWKKEVLWSNPVYTADNVLVHLGKKPVTKVQDLYGQKVGTIFDFIYPILSEGFQTKKILREDAPTIDSNIKKLLFGRINYIVTTHFEYHYYKKLHPELQRAELKMDSFETRCALSKKSKITLAELNKSIETIKKNGVLDKILRTYQIQ